MHADDGRRPGDSASANANTWRPGIRAAVISKARVNMHRKRANAAKATGQYPLGVLPDRIVHASPGPSPLGFPPLYHLRQAAPRYLPSRDLPPACAQRLFDAQQHGAPDRELRAIVAEGLQDICFKDGGTRADQLEVELTDIDYIDVSF
ncbi:hypothetical protein [Streptomyces nojiriensis]|uniref:hypothetical protein n=1 Tax=Streptomyces nojiriensis TaxID=66374 RepID=UPI0036C4AED9